MVVVVWSVVLHVVAGCVILHAVVSRCTELHGGVGHGVVWSGQLVAVIPYCLHLQPLCSLKQLQINA